MYTYYVGNKEYSDNYSMFINAFERYNVDTIIVKYNTIFPSISIIDGIHLKKRQQKVGIVLSSIFILFLLLLWNLGDREKWFKRYGG